MAETFARCFKGPNVSEGHALYPKVLGSQMKPGACGYFNRQHDWVTIIQTLDDANLKARSLNRPEQVEIIEYEVEDEWGARKSSSVSGKRVEVDGKASIPGGIGGGFALTFESTRGEGAVMVVGSKVDEHRAEPASAFRKWMAENVDKLSALPLYDEEVVRDKGLWLITKTFTAARKSVAVLESSGSEISLGLAVSAPGVAEGQPSASFWSQNQYDSGWIVHQNPKDKGGVVLFASGIYYQPQLWSKKLKVVEDKEKQKWLAGDKNRSPIVIELVKDPQPDAEFVRLWPCAFGKPDGLSDLPNVDDEKEE